MIVHSYTCVMCVVCNIFAFCTKEKDSSLIENWILYHFYYIYLDLISFQIIFTIITIIIVIATTIYVFLIRINAKKVFLQLSSHLHQKQMIDDDDSDRTGVKFFRPLICTTLFPRVWNKKSIYIPPTLIWHVRQYTWFLKSQIEKRTGTQQQQQQQNNFQFAWAIPNQWMFIYIGQAEARQKPKSDISINKSY